MFAGLSLKTKPATDAPKAQVAAPASSFSFMGGATTETSPTASATSANGRESPSTLSSSVPADNGGGGGFSFINAGKEEHSINDTSPSNSITSASSSTSTNGFSFMNNTKNDITSSSTPPPTSGGFSFINQPEVPTPTPAATGFSFLNNDTPSKSVTTGSALSPSDIPLGAPSTKPVVKKKRAPKVRVGYAREMEDEQSAKGGGGGSVVAPPPTAAVSVQSTSGNVGGSASISELGMDDLPSSVMEEISAAEMLEKRLQEEQEAKEVAEAIEAVAKAEAENKAKEESEAKALEEAKKMAEAHQAQAQAQDSAASSVTSKAMSWLMGGNAAPTTSAPAIPSVTSNSDSALEAKVAPVEVVNPTPITLSPSNEEEVKEQTPSVEVVAPISIVSTSAPVSLVPSSFASTQEQVSSESSYIQTTQALSLENNETNVKSTTDVKTEDTPVDETESLKQELDFILSEFVDEMEKKCQSIENDHEAVTGFEERLSQLTRDKAETLQALHSFEAKQIKLAEAEDYEGAEALTSVVEEHKSKVLELESELQQTESQLSQLKLSLESKRSEQEDRIVSLEASLSSFEQRPVAVQDSEAQDTLFATEGRRLQAERERLSAERGHVERDRKHLDDERNETETNINAQTKEITVEATELQLDLTGVEGDIASLEKQLAAKKKEAAALRRKLDASAAAVDLVRQKFDRQLQRIAEREVIIRRSEMECDSEEALLSEEEAKHAIRVTAFKGRREETERLKLQATSEREAALSLRESLKSISQARHHCNSSLNNKTQNKSDEEDDTDNSCRNESSPQSLDTLRESVVEAEAAARESDQKVAETTKKIEELKEEAKLCLDKIPQLEAAKKAAAAAKNFKEAGALSKEAKANEARKEECQSEAAELAACVEALELTRSELHGKALEVRSQLVNAEKEFDLKKLKALRGLAVELRHAELVQELKLASVAPSCDNGRNCLSYGALIMAKSEVKIIMKEIALLTDRSGVEDDWCLPSELPPDMLPSKEEEAVEETIEEEEVAEQDVVVEEDRKEDDADGSLGDKEEAVLMAQESSDGDKDEEELEQALRNLGGSLIDESLGDKDSGVTVEASETLAASVESTNSDEIAVMEDEQEQENEADLTEEALALASEEDEVLAAEEEANRREYKAKALDILKQMEELEAQTLQAAEEEEFDLADELQQKIFALEEEVNALAGLTDVHAQAVAEAREECAAS